MSNDQPRVDTTHQLTVAQFLELFEGIPRDATLSFGNQQFMGITDRGANKFVIHLDPHVYAEGGEWRCRTLGDEPESAPKPERRQVKVMRNEPKKK